MPIVLAIEPDRRQAAHLTAIVRNQVGAELVIADTTESALDAIGNRVPDLVLVPALLSPQDDAALAAALRVIAAAARVRTLTIPVLASGVKRTQAGGMLAKWRKTRAASPEPDGCDPAVFGEQIATYLQEAAVERAEREALEEDALLAGGPVADAPPVLNLEAELQYHPQTHNADTDVTSAPADEHAWTADAEAVQPLSAYSAEEEMIEATEEATDDPIAEPLIHAEAQPLLPAEAAASIDLSDQLAAMSEGSEDGAFDTETVAVYTIPAEADVAEPFDSDTMGIEAFDLLLAVQEPPLFAEDFEAALDLMAAAGRAGFKAARAEPASLPSARVDAPARPRLVQRPEPRADIASWVPMYLTPGRLWPALEGVPAETPAARTEQPDWIELVASLRQDLERRRTDHAAAAPRIAARSLTRARPPAVPPTAANADEHRLAKKPRAYAKTAKPVQDEWGFFDPEQCGFSTLLAKLEEITEEA